MTVGSTFAPPGPLGVAACEQDTPGLQTWAGVGQRYVQTNEPSSQRSVRMSQHSCAKGLQTRLWANTYCERGKGWTINVWHASVSPRSAVSKENDRFVRWFIHEHPRLNRWVCLQYNVK
jgi:hypothetical protein